MAKTKKLISNALTIDVEDYFMVSAFADVVKHENWHSYESRVKANTETILELLSEYDIKGTFFVLGWIADKYPELVKKIFSNGHEVASHGYSHRLIYDLTIDEFREDIRRSKGILEDITGTSVIGFRAASYSIIKDTLWALDILIEEGFQYDSSIFPIHHDRYGVPDAKRFSHFIKRNNNKIFEFPPSTYRICGQNIPIAGGGYFRLFPLWITKTAIKRINEQEKEPVIFYIHPWEIDANQPRLNGKWMSEIRHHINLKSTIHKLRTLLNEFKFKPLSEFLNE